ncbi:MAG: aspartyl protease family protein [Burkholderiales bacterium]
MALRRSACLFAMLALVLHGGQAFAQDAPKCRLQKIVEWQVRSIGRHMAVDGAINGQKIGIVLDTGASASVLFRASAKRLGLELKDTRERMYGVGGETKVDVTVVDEFRLGEVAVRGMRMRVAGERDPGEGFDLLLGEDFLRNFDIEFDLPNDAVRLWQPKDCERASLAYWTKDPVGEAPIEPVTDARRKIEVDVKLNGKTVHAILDSGASTSIVSKHDAEAVGAIHVGGTVGSSGMGARAVEAWVGKFETFGIGNEEIPDVEIRVADLYQGATYTGTGSRIAKNVFESQPMLLGADFLRAHRTMVAHSQRKLYFTYAGGPVFVARPPKPPPKQAAPESPKAD